METEKPLQSGAPNYLFDSCPKLPQLLLLLTPQNKAAPNPSSLGINHAGSAFSKNKFESMYSRQPLKNRGGTLMSSKAPLSLPSIKCLHALLVLFLTN